MLVVVFALSGLLMATLAGAYASPRLRSRRIFEDRGRKLEGARLYKRVFGNMIFSAALVFALAYGLYPWLIDDAADPGFAMLWHGAAILLVYDGLYYCMHRFAFHEWALLRKVHVVHHVVRHPRAVDSLYLHPVETFLGLALLTSCTLVIGPVHPATFAVVFAVYSFLNILVHSGLDLPFFPFRTVSHLARKHDLHHTSMKGGNYASITPLWDVLFGTAE